MKGDSSTRAGHHHRVRLPYRIAMGDFLIYKEVTEAQYLALEASTSTAEDVKALLVDIIGLSYEDDKKLAIAIDLFFYG